jgi:hypothetical protein
VKTKLRKLSFPVLFCLIGLHLFSCATAKIDSQRAKGKIVNGKLEIMDVSHGGDSNGLLLYDYGMMIWDDKWENDPTRYELFFQKEKMAFKTTDLEALKKELAKIPAGSRLYMYDTCTVSQRNGFSPTRMNEIEDRCKELGLTMVDGHHEDFKGHTICYCE